LEASGKRLPKGSLGTRNKKYPNYYPPFLKGGQGGLYKRLIIPLNPPLEKGDFLRGFGTHMGDNSPIIYESPARL
jgi:hypothetical protein